MGLGVIGMSTVVDGGTTTASYAIDDITIKLAMKVLRLVEVGGTKPAFEGLEVPSLLLVLVPTLLEPTIMVCLLDILSWFLVIKPLIILMHPHNLFEKYSKTKVNKTTF